MMWVISPKFEVFDYAWSLKLHLNAVFSESVFIKSVIPIRF